MTHMGLHWWPKHICTTTTTATNCGGSTSPENVQSPNCSCLSKLVRKLKKHSRMIRNLRRQSSSLGLQCRYDPLSYSLNFDTSGCGSLLDEEYYHFYAFSSRFVANATPNNACPRLVATSHWNINMLFCIGVLSLFLFIVLFFCFIFR